MFKDFLNSIQENFGADLLHVNKKEKITYERIADLFNGSVTKEKLNEKYECNTVNKALNAIKEEFETQKAKNYAKRTAWFLSVNSKNVLASWLYDIGQHGYLLYADSDDDLLTDAQHSDTYVMGKLVEHDGGVFALVRNSTNTLSAKQLVDIRQKLQDKCNKKIEFIVDENHNILLESWLLDYFLEHTTDIDHEVRYFAECVFHYGIAQQNKVNESNGFSDDAWDKLIKEPQAKEFVRVHSQILNGGFSQLFGNERNDKGRVKYLVEEARYFVRQFAPQHSVDFNEIMDEYVEVFDEIDQHGPHGYGKTRDEDLEEADKKWDAIDSKYYAFYKDMEDAIEKNYGKIKESKYKLTEEKYKSDKEIEDEFKDFKIVKIEGRGSSGWIEIQFPYGREHVGGGTDEVVDHWIKYPNGKIAFDNWYPEDVYKKLVAAIEKHLSSANEAYDYDSREDDGQSQFPEADRVALWIESKIDGLYDDVDWTWDWDAVEGELVISKNGEVIKKFYKDELQKSRILDDVIKASETNFNESVDSAKKTACDLQLFESFSEQSIQFLKPIAKMIAAQMHDYYEDSQRISAYDVEETLNAFMPDINEQLITLIIEELKSLDHIVESTNESKVNEKFDSTDKHNLLRLLYDLEEHLENNGGEYGKITAMIQTLNLLGIRESKINEQFQGHPDPSGMLRAAHDPKNTLLVWWYNIVTAEFRKSSKAESSHSDEEHQDIIKDVKNRGQWLRGRVFKYQDKVCMIVYLFQKKKNVPSIKLLDAFHKVEDSLPSDVYIDYVIDDEGDNIKHMFECNEMNIKAEPAKFIAQEYLKTPMINEMDDRHANGQDAKPIVEEPVQKDELHKEEKQQVDDKKQEENDQKKMYFGAKADSFFYLLPQAKVDGVLSDMQLLSADGKVLDSAGDAVADLVKWIQDMIKKYEMDSISIDVLNAYIFPPIEQAEEVKAEEQSTLVEPIETPNENEIVSKEPLPDEKQQ